MDTTEPATHRLYSPGQIAAASFLGSPISASWFFARNYRQLGDAKKATQSLIWGVLGTAVLLFISFHLPEHFPNMALPIGYTVGLYQLAKQRHGAVVAQHVARGGRLGSNWTVIGISILTLVLVLGAVFAVVLLQPENFNEAVEQNGFCGYSFS